MQKTWHINHFSENSRIVFLSPHDDDVVWSCGGIIAKLIQEKKNVLIIKFFDSYSENIISSNQKKLSDWRKKTIIPDRESENIKAMECLNVKYISLGFPEAAIRKDSKGNFIYNNFLSLFRSIHSADQYFTRLVEKKLSGILTQNDNIIIPFALGGHVDHQIASLVTKSLNLGQRYFYMEFPYNFKRKPENFSYKNLQPNAFPIDFEIWIKASLCYQSQIKLFFPKEKNFVEALKGNIKPYPPYSKAMLLYKEIFA